MQFKVPFSIEEAKIAQMELAKSMGKLMESKIDLGKGVKLEMVLIPAGKFIMGEPGKDHEVTLTKPFYMGKYEVTQMEWQAVMGNNPSQIKGARLPVTNVSWNDCQDFIKKLNARRNGFYRLPTEAEWEYACRAGTTTVYSFGNKIAKSDANWGAKQVAESIKDVGNYKPNALGIYDMHGNVWERSEDWFGDYSAGALIDPKGPTTGVGRVLRGGSFAASTSLNVRSTVRNYSTPSDRSISVGFRLAKIP